MADIHTIGAGGGSIAYLDSGGALRVGPESAGADPGPACYARGGQRPAVTDANVVLGRLPADLKLGGSLSLDLAAARRAIDTVAQPLGMSTEISKFSGWVTSLFIGFEKFELENLKKTMDQLSTNLD